VPINCEHQGCTALTELWHHLER